MEQNNQLVVTEKYKGDWYTYKSVNIVLPDKEPYHYEYITRTEKCAKGGVEVIPVLQKGKDLYLILIKNFRYPINDYCIEFPGGMIDANETVEQAATRELWEETGYTITQIISVEEAIQVDPWKSDDTNTVVIGLIDGDAEINQNISLHLDATERMDLLVIEWSKINEELSDLRKQFKVMNSIGYFLTFKKFFNLKLMSNSYS